MSATPVCVDKVIRRPEGIVNDESKLLEAFGVGDASMQGDIIIVCIGDNGKLPKGCKPRENRQLAEGDTQGSRHILERGTPYDCDPKTVVQAIRKATNKKKFDIEPQYIGPVFVSPECPTADDLTHPEHGNQGFPAGSVCAVVFQKNLDAEEREARVRD